MAAGPSAAGPRTKKSTAVVALIVGGVVVGVCCVGGGLTALVLPTLKKNIADRQSVPGAAAPATNVPTTQLPITNVPVSGAPTTGSSNGTDPLAAATTDPAVAATIGQPARGTTFEFTVTKLKCGVSRVGDNFINATAQGQFCLVTLTVKNVGSDPTRYSPYYQTAVGPDGVTYRGDDQAEFWVNSKNNLPFMKDINPGNSETGILVYDIPKGGKLVSLELFDGASDSLSISLQR